MKKILLLLMIGTALSCSDDDNKSGDGIPAYAKVSRVTVEAEEDYYDRVYDFTYDGNRIATIDIEGMLSGTLGYDSNNRLSTLTATSNSSTSVLTFDYAGNTIIGFSIDSSYYPVTYNSSTGYYEYQMGGNVHSFYLNDLGDVVTYNGTDFTYQQSESVVDPNAPAYHILGVVMDDSMLFFLSKRAVSMMSNPLSEYVFTHEFDNGKVTSTVIEDDGNPFATLTYEY